MKTLQLIQQHALSIPMTVSWYLSDIGRAQGLNACPGVSIDLIRKVLKRLKGSSVECLGRGPAARWRKLN